MLTFHLSTLPTTRSAWQPIKPKSSFWDSDFSRWGGGAEETQKHPYRLQCINMCGGWCYKNTLCVCGSPKPTSRAASLTENPVIQSKQRQCENPQLTELMSPWDGVSQVFKMHLSTHFCSCCCCCSICLSVISLSVHTNSSFHVVWICPLTWINQDNFILLLKFHRFFLNGCFKKICGKSTLQKRKA